MKIQIPYLDKFFPLEFNDENLLAIAEPNDFTAAGTAEEILGEAIAHPIESVSLAGFLRGGKKLLVIINDATRPTPTEAILKGILPVAEKAGIADKDITLLVATGAHRAPTDEEYIQIFSEKHYRKHKDRIFVHDAKKGEDMVYLGTSKNGTEMRVNRRGVEADRIVIISSVEPHYFAGYTGGRKSFLPGIAAHETITQNHKLALKREACALRLEGNPVHEDMIDALGTVKKEVFAINTVLDKHHRIYAAVAGDVHQSLDPAISKANDVFVAEIPEKCDIVVSVVKFPSDIDLYQAQKGIDNAKYALKEGGILLLVAKCRMGVGDDSFVKLLSSASSPADALKKIEQGFVLGYHKAAKMAEVGLSAEVWAVTDLDPALLESIFIKPFASLQEALDAALAKKGPDAKALVLLDGSLTIPHVKA